MRAKVNKLLREVKRINHLKFNSPYPVLVTEWIGEGVKRYGDCNSEYFTLNEYAEAKKLDPERIQLITIEYV